MPKSKSNKNHKERLARYKSNKKKEQDAFKKKLIDQYVKMQQQAVADKESHTSTEEISGPEVNIDDLLVNENQAVIDVNTTEITENTPMFDINPDIENIVTDDNNNK